MVWTGSEVLVLGGNGDDVPLSGAAYNPSTDSWRTLPNAPFDGGQWKYHRYSIVWTGDKAIAVSDWDDAVTSYDPSTNQWSPLVHAPEEAQDIGGAAVWTGSRVIIFGSWVADPGAYRGTVSFDPGGSTWEVLNVSPMEFRNPDTLPVWTGSEALVFNNSKAAAAYNPGTDSWRELPDVPIDGTVSKARVVWTGEEAVWLFGHDGENDSYPKRAAAYSPTSDSWRRLPDAPVPGRSEFGAARTPKGILVFGGIGRGNPGLAPALYDLAKGEWKSIPEHPGNWTRYGLNGIWAGTRAFFFGQRDHHMAENAVLWNPDEVQ